MLLLFLQREPRLVFPSPFEVIRQCKSKERIGGNLTRLRLTHVVSITASILWRKEKIGGKVETRTASVKNQTFQKMLSLIRKHFALPTRGGWYEPRTQCWELQKAFPFVLLNGTTGFNGVCYREIILQFMPVEFQSLHSVSCSSLQDTCLWSV